ncbi:Intraflagellar transport protein 56 [Lobulomyces angularis]|nr:Intraflagellar transport protein 56 [Lobulomyces angularis]
MSELEKETGDISVLHWLIYEHLVHNCYSETANSFSSSTQISNINNNSSTNSNEDVEMKDAKRLDTTINRPSSFNQASIASEDSKSLEDRKVIYHLVNSGNIKDAIEYCNSAFPNSLSGTTPESLYMCFLLHCQQFIEYIRIDSNEAFTFAQEELGRFAYMGEKFKSHLQDVISLIAYPDPKNSPQVSTFLSSGYFYNDDTFNYNYGQAKVAAGSFEEAEEALLMIQSEKFKGEYAYLSHLARCYITNKKPRLAWELYLKMETSSESFSLLQLIANDCYKLGHYYFAMKAFDVLERLDPSPEYWEGKRGACIGVFQKIIVGQEPKEYFRDVITILRNTSNPQVEYIIRVMKKYAKENRLQV